MWRGDNQDTLAAVQGRFTDHLACDECFAKPHLVSDEDAVPPVQDALGAPHAVGLEQCQSDLGVLLVFVV